MRDSRILHGHSPKRSKSPEYVVWSGMLDRCTNPKSRSWNDYGGRGIRVCERWHDFSLFLEDMGPRPPGTSIDRRDNDGNYDLGNARWATRIEQACNTRRTRLSYEIADEMRRLRAGGLRICDLATRFGVSKSTVEGVVYGGRWKRSDEVLAALRGAAADCEGGK